MKTAISRISTRWRAMGLLGGLLMLLGGCASGPELSAVFSLQTSQAVPRQPPVAYQRALVLLERGETRRAILLFSDLSRRHPGWAPPFVQLARAYATRDEYGMALDCLNNALRLSPGEVTVMHQRARLYQQWGRYAQAAEAYAALLRRDPDYAPAHRDFGLLLDTQLAQPALAVRHLRRYLELSGARPGTLTPVDEGRAQAEISQRVRYLQTQLSRSGPA